MSTPSTSSIFEDFDQKATFESFKDVVRSPYTLNFILDFDSKSARCAFDLGTQAVEAALQERDSRSEVCKPLSSPLLVLISNFARLRRRLEHDGCMYSPSRYHDVAYKYYRNIWCPEKQQGIIRVGQYLIQYRQESSSRLH